MRPDMSMQRQQHPSIKVDFVVAGTQKGGTSALDEYLRDHRGISMASKKEVHFFDDDSNFGESVEYSKYHSYFEISEPRKILGEATPIYMYWYEAPKRIWHYNPEMKFIIVLRNPVNRAYSHWNMQRDRAYDDLSFWEAITTEESRRREALPCQHRKFSYVDRGFYSEQLKRIWHFFPKEQTLIMRSKDLREKPENVLCDICRFLNISDFENIRLKEVHSRPYTSSISSEERDFLQKTFFYEIKELEELLGWDCSDWLI
jgi:hypothetical protein